jgi:hypothetical protein
MPIVYDDYVKAPNQEIEYTPEMIRKLNKCDKDRLYFVKEYIKIVTGDYGVVKFGDYMFPFQEHLINDFINYRFTVNLCGRQQGKTTVVGAYVLSYACFESHKTIGIVSNKEASAKSFLSRIKYMYEQIPSFLKPGVLRWAEKSVEFDNHCKIMIAATSKDSFRGEPINCITGNAKICFISDCGKIFYTSMEKATSSKYNKINYKKDGYMRTVKDKKFYTVYKTTNKINNKIYIGFHSTNDLSDGYLGSGKILKRAIEKYGVENFEKEYIDIFDNKEDAELLERNIVNKDFVKMKDNYNISLGGNVCILYGEDNGFYGKTHTKETLNKIQKTRGTYNHTDDTKQLLSDMSIKMWSDDNFKLTMSEKRKGFKHSDETKDKMSKSSLGKKHNEDTKQLLSKIAHERHKNMTKDEYDNWYKQVFTEERNKKISDALTGRKIPKEIVDKINKNPDKIRKTAEKHRGMKRSKETRKNISDACKGRHAYNKGKVYCYNPDTLEKKLCLLEDVPKGWNRGFVPKCKS